MADILIRGMEMPTGEPLRIVLNPNGQLFVDHGVTFTEYEAVELPEHGEVIDRDAFIKNECLDRDCLDCECDDRCDMIKNLKTAPVIVPASKEETE